MTNSFKCANRRQEEGAQTSPAPTAQQDPGVQEGFTGSHSRAGDAIADLWRMLAPGHGDLASVFLHR
jgi:hypothetical protein